MIELFNPSINMLACESGRRNPIGQYEDPKDGSQVLVTDETGYQAASQINHIKWFFRNQGSTEEVVRSFEMRQFFPQEIYAQLGTTIFGWSTSMATTMKENFPVIRQSNLSSANFNKYSW